MQSFLRTRAGWIVIAVSFLTGVVGATRQRASPIGDIELDQNWSADVQAEFWFTSQGSRLLPYSWFLALKQANSRSDFKDPAHMEGVPGYVIPPAVDSVRNPDGLPIGFVRDPARRAAPEAYVGITCAACHTARMRLGKSSVIVDGAPAEADFSRLMRELVEALESTIDVSAPERFAEFAADVLPDPRTDDDLATLRAAVATRAAELRQQIVQHSPAGLAGPGRLDAFGNVNNQVVAYMLGRPANAKPADAPVSYPFLWDTPQHDLVQWNGSGNNLLLVGLGAVFRNVGQALAAFSTVELVPTRGAPRYASSINVAAIERLEALVTRLQSPVWPEPTLGKIDKGLARRGRAIYGVVCVECHAILDRADPRRRVKAHMVDVTLVGTDLRLATNYAERFTDPTGAETGPLNGRLKTYPPLGRFGSHGAGADIFSNLVLGAYRGRNLSGGRLPKPFNGDASESRNATAIRGFSATARTAAAAYKARPLNGIWATAPYLHNGSVSTIWELLNEPRNRSKRFFVGHNAFDPKEVGISGGKGDFLFDTERPGNANIGHSDGTTLNGDQKMALLEYIKTL